MKRRYDVPYGKHLISMEIDPARVRFDLAPGDVPPAENPIAEIRRSLDSPVGSPLLRELISPGKRIVILGDDQTRLTPTDKIVPLVLDDLSEADARDDDITLVIATGTHRPMSDEEIARKYGSPITDRVKVVNHDCLDEANLVSCGRTRRGTDIWVNRIVLAADVRIGVGNVVPHHPTGWSGGAKILLPGVASRLTTGQMHLLGASEQLLGEIDTPCRQEMEDFAASVGLDFVVNTVLDGEARLVRAEAGHYVSAHREAVRWGQRVFGAEFPEKADITISSTHPIDFDLFQADKGLFSAARCTNEGGEIVLLSPCHEGVSPTHGEAVELSALTDEQLWKLLASANEHDPLSIAEALYFNTIKRYCRVTVVTGGIPPEQARKMGFNYVPPSEVTAYLEQRLSEDRNAGIGILRNSVETLPMQTH